MSNTNLRNPVTRREALRRVGNGFGMMAFAGMLGESLAKAGAVSTPDGSIGVAKLDYPQRVKRVIFLFMNGGCSHVDSFDPKPTLEKYDGQPLPGGTIKTERRTGELMKSPFKFKKYGQCGMDVSELWPHLGEVADDICWVRSVYTDIPNHEPSCLMMNTGANQAGRPSMGAWLTYGLGTENQNLPGYVVLCPGRADHGRAAAVEQRISAGHPPGNVHFESRADAPQADGMDMDMMAEDDARRRGRWRRTRTARRSPRRSSIETSFDPKKLVSYVNNPKFSLTEQRREMDLLQKLERHAAGDRPAPTSRWRR